MDVKKCERILLLARQGPALAGTWRTSSVVWVSREFDTFCEVDTLRFIFPLDMSFCYFRALDMTPTYAVPGLLIRKSYWRIFQWKIFCSF